jgi:MFS family permease
VVGIGETFWSPSTPGIVNDLAPDRLRARYNAMLGFADAGGALIGPPLAGLVIGAGAGGGFLVAIAVACVFTVLAVRNLEHVLPHAANIVGGEEAVLATAAAEPLSPTL